MRDITPSAIRELAADIDMELTRLGQLEDDIAKVNRTLEQNPGQAEWLYENLALKLHNFYTGCEKVLQLIATELNGGLPAGPDWHKRLLDRMATERQGRPAVLRMSTASALREYLGFRHIVRNLYGFELQPERVARLVDTYPQVWHDVAQDYGTFVTWLEDLATTQEGG
ncbi:hypothetical protein [Nodosilinea sp. P-1105]|uniref:ribonuclease toxin HepT-like protein n=1 Tax=Nodosilinea sp. P-1105 TaxID=2546229 RepID=UPI00146AF663|nr:hypothetical protein [Nodosilinea sp. P-1105]NMF85624.1 hypothetical protein [Nodosilinea sp. P-1105]